MLKSVLEERPFILVLDLAQITHLALCTSSVPWGHPYFLSLTTRYCQGLSTAEWEPALVHVYLPCSGSVVTNKSLLSEQISLHSPSSLGLFLTWREDSGPPIFSQAGTLPRLPSYSSECQELPNTSMPSHQAPIMQIPVSLKPTLNVESYPVFFKLVVVVS